MAVRKAGEADVLALLRGDKYRYLQPEDYPSEMELLLDDSALDVDPDDVVELRRAEQGDGLSPSPSQLIAFEAEIAARLKELRLRHPELPAQDLLAIALQGER